ncbi:hypothetical protein QTO01_10120 [Vibrio mytili]|uniref:PepSY domain-containing protein n=1 Tax=Vibrio mytili TaxID=50718 RepID=UPI002F4164EA
MNKSYHSRNFMLVLGLVPLLHTTPGLANTNVTSTSNHVPQNGHAIVQDMDMPGARVEFDEDQDDVYRAVQQGHIRPFSELYVRVEQDLFGRIIKVELDEDNNEWVYELKILFDNSVLKVEYDAATLEMLQVKGRNFNKALKPQHH